MFRSAPLELETERNRTKQNETERNRMKQNETE